MTPNISFAPNPVTHETGEREYHDSARKEFESLLAKFKPAIERNVEILRKEFDQDPKLVAYSEQKPEINFYQLEEKRKAGGSFRIGLTIRYPDQGELELAVSKAPAKAQWEALQARVHALFSVASMGPCQKGTHYRLALTTYAEFTVDPVTGETATPLLDNLRPKIEKKVSRLLSEFGKDLSLSPVNDAYPELWDGELGAKPADGPCRISIKLRDPADPCYLELFFERTPAEERFRALAKRACDVFSAD